MANFDDFVPQPGPTPGSSRPAGAPNFGSMGGRPTSPRPSGGSPMEKLGAEIPMAPLPGIYSPAPTPSAGGGFASSPGGPIQPPAAAAEPPKAQAPGGSVININVGGQPAPLHGGEMWPDAQAPQTPAPQAAPPRPGEMWPDLHGGEMWPDAQAPAPVPTAPAAPIVFDRLPFEDELASVPDGAMIRTPWGDARVVGGAVPPGGFTLNAAGKQAWASAKMQRVEAFGAHPWAGDPRAPQPPAEPGRPAFNPFMPDGQGWSE